MSLPEKNTSSYDVFFFLLFHTATEYTTRLYQLLETGVFLVSVDEG